MLATTINHPCTSPTLSSSFSRQIKLPNLGFHLGKLKSHLAPFRLQTFPPQSQILKFTSLLADDNGIAYLRGLSVYHREIKAINVKEGDYLSAWDEKPYEVLPNGRKFYFDEQDVVAFIDPPKELIPLEPASYNPAAYLWKKIGDIPDERRHRLLSLLKPRLVSRIWDIAGTRYDDPKLAKQSASSLLSDGDSATSLDFWHCRTSGGSMPIAWINFFKKAIFRCNDAQTCGRIIFGGSVLSGITNSFSPLYFTVREHKEVMATEQPCDVAYEFGDGILDLCNLPEGFPRPAKHPWPFNDHVVVYVRHVGPGVLVGQAWQEGKVLEQVPKKLCGEIIMMKNYIA